MSSTNASRANHGLAAPTRLLQTYLEEAAAKLSRRREIVGDRIREARDAKGWLQKELGSRVHVEAQTVSNWERGVSTPDLDMLELIARELERPVAFFLLEPGDAVVATPGDLDALRAEVAEVRELAERILARLEKPPRAASRAR